MLGMCPDRLLFSVKFPRVLHAVLLGGRWGVVVQPQEKGSLNFPEKHQAFFKEHRIISDELLKLCFLIPIRKGNTQPCLKS